MRTIIVTSITYGAALPLLLGFALLGKCLICRVAGFLQEIAFPYRPGDPVITLGIWIFALFSMLAAISPASLPERITGVLMLAFLLQSGITDAVSGFLPLVFTGRFLLAGLLTGGVSTESIETIYLQWQETAIMGALMLIVNTLFNRSVQRIGRGDLWLIVGITAWSGLQDAALVTLCGMGGFFLWQFTWYLSGKKEGPLGPWLCISGGCFLLNHLYQPVWITIR
ncbi:prepilin peptidase [Pectobacterium aroidearum]|uniref:prepilin peptidase n=1 Tax=Pectobacterium aroidearum TaxID=1201031 RepID=UPI0031593DE6